jgi:hypothetical protein
VAAEISDITDLAEKPHDLFRRGVNSIIDYGQEAVAIRLGQIAELREDRCGFRPCDFSRDRFHDEVVRRDEQSRPILVPRVADELGFALNRYALCSEDMFDFVGEDVVFAARPCASKSNGLSNS